MTEWWQTTTTDLLDRGVIEIGDGYRAKNAEFVEEGGLPFVRVGDIGSTIRVDGIDELPLERAGKYGPKVSRPFDSLITMKGTVGRVAFVHDGIRSFVYSPQISYWRSLDPAAVHPRWLRYWLESPEFLSQAFATKGATDMADYINLRDQRRMRITLPPPSTQHQIADVLGAIDDLIENNRRRIELLEQMAQAIYREWFVRFRYPGHQDATFVDTPIGPIPDGWELVTLRDCAASLEDGDWIETKDQGGQDFRLLQVSNIAVGRFRETGNYRYVTQQTFDRLRCREIKLGDLLIPRMPDPIGRAWLVDHLTEPAITSVDVAILTPASASMGCYLNQVLNSATFLAHAESVATGTTRKRITRTVLGQYQLPRPSQIVLDQFGESVAALSECCVRLRLAADELGHIRDLLLPRLVTGRIDLSSIDVDAVLESVG